MRGITVLLLLSLPVVAWGDCTQHLQSWAQTLHPTLALDREHAVCKANPADASQVLAALPMKESVDEYGQGDYGLAVVLADAASGKILAHSYEPAAIVSDAMAFNDLKLDTAPYQLAPGRRAFGVRVQHTGLSRANPRSSETLSLYLHDGAQLRRLLGHLVVSESVAEWQGYCAGKYSEALRTVAVGKPGKEGFANLRVTEVSRVTVSVATGEETCEDTEGKRQRKVFNFAYGANHYQVPKKLTYQ
ncbi:hypothetical protein [Pseudomonas xanthosomatis]|uniref:hypothetical protein n=1 Tax=Pseudomonas xanthosomatis TaxID=2842356 RepID=UPI003515B1F6